MRNSSAIDDLVSFIKGWNRVKVDISALKKWNQMRITREDIDKALKARKPA